MLMPNPQQHTASGCIRIHARRVPDISNIVRFGRQYSALDLGLPAAWAIKLGTEPRPVQQSRSESPKPWPAAWAGSAAAGPFAGRWPLVSDSCATTGAGFGVGGGADLLVR